MAEPEQSILREVGFWLAGASGGVVDYLNQLSRGERKWSLAGFAVHILSAVFFGYLAGSVATGLGYPPGICHSLGGLGGFLGTRLADLALMWLKNRTGS